MAFAVCPEIKSCPTCGWGMPLSERHECPPAWFIWEDGQTREDVDPRPVYANDGEDAVERWAEREDNDSAEYDIAKNPQRPLTVCVQREGGPIVKYTVQGEYQPVYYAWEVT